MATHINFKLLADCYEHIPQLAKLHYQEIGQHWVLNASIESTEQRLMDHDNKDRLPLTFVALHAEQPIGMASLRENDGIRSDLTPWLGSLVVDPRFRGKQLGQMLVDKVKQQAKLFNYDELYLFAFDSTIPNWYAKLSWKTIGVDELFDHSITVMRITL